MVLVIVIMASCAILVGISYLMLDIFSGLVVTPKTPVKESDKAGELILPLSGVKVISMQASADGRFLAYVKEGAAGGGMLLNVIEPDADNSASFSLEVRGDSLAWLGDTLYLAYEDGGDIHLLSMEEGTTVDLTASGAFDTDPIPSPDGRYILWTVGGESGGQGEAELWVMEADGSDQAVLAEFQDLPAWDPAGGKVVSRHGTTLTETGDSYRYILQTATPGGGGWEYYTECDGEVRFIWWPLQDEVLYVSPESTSGEDGYRGVWSRVDPPAGLKKVASTDGLGFDQAYYRFYPARGEGRLAYVGEKGLEVMDYEERVIYGYPLLEAETPLAWDEANNELYFVGPEGIYRVSLEGG